MTIQVITLHMNGLHGGTVLLFNMLICNIIKQHTDLNFNQPFNTYL